MNGQYKYFAILAGMRTGSNLLEERLNGLDGIHSYGELFNPAFVGHANQTKMFGLSPSDIASKPDQFLDRLIENEKVLPGFRLFEGHNQHILERCLTDPACAKIVLRRNPVDSFVSLRIAQATNQWRINDARNAKKARIDFDVAEFTEYFERNRDHYSYIARTMGAAGETAFMLDYTQLNDPSILEGLARFLGVEPIDFRRNSATKKQNPEPLSQKVRNYQEMIAQLGDLDPLGLFNDPSFEPHRAPAVKSYYISAANQLQYLPIEGGPNDTVISWMRDLAQGQEVLSGYSQKALRTWKRETPGHVAFAVIRHPALRAWHAYKTHLIEPGRSNFTALRQDMIQLYGVELPGIGKVSEHSTDTLKKGFLSFLTFLQANLANQTKIRIDASWASQVATIDAYSNFSPVHLLLKEDDLERELAYIANRVGASAIPPQLDVSLSAEFLRIYDAEVESAVRNVYRRDYMAFGFGDWGQA